MALYGWLFQLLMCRKRCWGLGGFRRLLTLFNVKCMAIVSDRLAPTSMADDHSGTSSRHRIVVCFNRPQPQQMSHVARDCIPDIP